MMTEAELRLKTGWRSSCTRQVWPAVSVRDGGSSPERGFGRRRADRGSRGRLDAGAAVPPAQGRATASYQRLTWSLYCRHSSIRCAARRRRFTQKKSRFVGYAAPAMTEADAEAFIADIHRRHPDASSLCWGYRVGPGGAVQRYHDDHEPSGGQPILEVLARRELSSAAAVARWFGGVKLGAGPLGRAFGRAAALAVGPRGCAGLG